jgi:hypothetical protein
MEEISAHSGRQHLRHKFKKRNLFRFRRPGLFSQWSLGELNDISKGGMGFRCLARLKVHKFDVLEIKLGHRVFKGEVRYTFREGIDRKVGVKFSEPLSISDLYSLNVSSSVATSQIPPKREQNRLLFNQYNQTMHHTFRGHPLV